MLCLPLVVLLILLPDLASARRRRAPLYRIYDWSGEVAVDVRYDDDRQETSGQVAVEEKEWVLGQEIRLGAKGWFFHPALLDFSAQVGLGLEQDRSDSGPGGASSNVDRTSPDFRLNVELFPYKPYPISFFGFQSRTDVDAPLAPRRTVESLGYGVALNLPRVGVGEWDVPSRMAYRHQETETDGRFGSDRSRDEIKLVLDNRTENSRNRLEYQWDMRDSGARSSASTRQELRLTQDLELEGGSLSSRFLVLDEAGRQLDTRSIALGESLTRNLTDRLSSSLRYNLLYLDSSQVTRTSHSGGMSLSHRLYGSLVSSVAANGSFSDSDQGQVWRAGGTLGLDYTKRIPGGRFGLRFSPSYSRQEEDLNAGILAGVEEDHAVSFEERILLERPFVLVDTIRVFDPETLHEFQRDLDFEVVQMGAWTELKIRPGSALDPQFPPLAGTVEVRYDAEALPSRTYTTIARTSGFSLSLFDHLRFNLSHNRTSRDLVKGVARADTLESSERFLATFDANFAHNRTHAEYERTESNINPQKRYSLYHTLSFRPSRDAAVSLTAAYSRDEITDTGRISKVYSLSSNASAWLPFRILMHLNLLARDLRQEDQDVLMAGGSVSLNYQYGRLRFQLQGGLSWTESESTIGREQIIEDRVSSVFLRVSRRF